MPLKFTSQMFLFVLLVLSLAIVALAFLNPKADWVQQVLPQIVKFWFNCGFLVLYQILK